MQEFPYYIFSFVFGFFQIIIHHYNIELWRKSHFVICLTNSLFNHFRGISATINQTIMKNFFTWWRNKNGKGFISKLFFYIYSTHHINIKNYIFTTACNALHFAAKCTIVTIWIYFFVFQKLMIINLLTKFFWRKEIILNTMLFIPPWSTTGCRNRKL